MNTNLQIQLLVVALQANLRSRLDHVVAAAMAGLESWEKKERNSLRTGDDARILLSDMHS